MQSDLVRNRLLAVIAAVVLIAALRWAYPVVMPLVVAVFIIAAAWPIRKLFPGSMPAVISYGGTMIVLFVIMAVFFAAIYYSIAEVATTFIAHDDRFRALYAQYVNWARPKGLPTLDGSGGYDRLLAIGRTLAADLYTFLTYLGMISVIVVLGFPEVPAMARKVRDRFARSENIEIASTVTEIAGSIQQYLAMTVLSSLITGVACGLWSLAVGLELALIWGILNFLLNFIPVVGNIVGVIPPTLYAFIQFDGFTMPLVIFGGFLVLQLVISNFVYPMLQSHGLSMPPVTIIVSLLFWGWLWGFAGGLLAVPLTAVLVIVGRRLDTTRKFALVLGQEEGAEDG
ncbi:AI-2E family transporter [Jiella sp. M17.18]|uniref:AI-2E family transporter n=1 Tax=Jiella sp. M17.18 TaxID=3234247 RepID=UPI0034DFB91C